MRRHIEVEGSSFRCNAAELIPMLTHWCQNKMAASLQTTFSNAFAWTKVWYFDFKFWFRNKRPITGLGLHGFWLGLLTKPSDDRRHHWATRRSRFTKMWDLSSPDLTHLKAMTSGTKSYSFALKFGRWLSSNAAEPPAKYQSNWILLTICLMALKFCKIRWKVISLLNSLRPSDAYMRQ